MLNRLPELEQEDKRYNLHVGADAPDSYNITLVYPDWTPPKEIKANLMSPQEVKNKLSKLGIFL
jgi:hypothetical protein